MTDKDRTTNGRPQGRPQVRTQGSGTQPPKHGLSTTLSPSPGVESLLCSQPSFSQITQRWLTSHGSSSTFRQLSNQSHLTSSINCKVSAAWGSVPRGARKWKQKKKAPQRFRRCLHLQSLACHDEQTLKSSSSTTTYPLRRVQNTFCQRPDEDAVMSNATIPPSRLHS